MYGEDPVEDGIDWLAIGESISDKAIISRGSRGMQSQIRDWGAGMSMRTKRGEVYQDTHTLWLR